MVQGSDDRGQMMNGGGSRTMILSFWIRGSISVTEGFRICHHLSLTQFGLKQLRKTAIQIVFTFKLSLKQPARIPDIGKRTHQP